MNEKYQYKPFQGSSHSWALRILENIPKDAEVLDIGAGTGIIGAKLKENGVDNLHAVEIEDERFQNLKEIYQQVRKTVEEVPQEEFDYIIMLDILEHLTKPFDFFDRMNKRLKPGGEMLISLPNIAHWSTRFGLLFGFFEYTERGLLDKTHYNHFNRRRVHKLIESQAELQLVSFKVSTSPCEFVLPEWLWDNSIYNKLDQYRLKIANTFPGLLGYQHLVHLKKRQ